MDNCSNGYTTDRPKIQTTGRKNGYTQFLQTRKVTSEYYNFRFFMF